MPSERAVILAEEREPTQMILSGARFHSRIGQIDGKGMFCSKSENSSQCPVVPVRKHDNSTPEPDASEGIWIGVEQVNGYQLKTLIAVGSLRPIRS